MAGFHKSKVISRRPLSFGGITTCVGLIGYFVTSFIALAPLGWVTWFSWGTVLRVTFIALSATVLALSIDLWKKLNKEDEGLFSDDSPMYADGSGEIAPNAVESTDPIVSRVLEVVNGQGVHLALKLDPEYNANNVLQKFVFFSQKKGELSKPAVQKKVRDFTYTAVPGKWLINFNTLDDTVTVARAREFPTVVYRAPYPDLARTVDEAIEYSTNFKIRVGIDRAGNNLEYKCREVPHFMILSGTGGGKTVLLSNIIQDARRAGCMIAIADNKGTSYLKDVSNVTSTTSNTLDFEVYTNILHILRVYEILESRKKVTADKNKDPSATSKYPYPRLLFIFDEFATFMSNLKSLTLKSHKGLYDVVIDALSKIVLEGREFRITSVFASQVAKADVIPTQLRDNIRGIITLGQMDDTTLKIAFPDESRREAKALGFLIEDKEKGRGIIFDRETKSVVEVKVDVGYSPYTSKDEVPAEMWTELERVKPYFENGITNLWPRFAPELLDKSIKTWDVPPKLSAKEEKERGDRPLQDTEKHPIQRIREISWIKLMEENGTIIPEAEKYNPASIKYEPY